MNSNVLYCIDTSALIYGWRDHYPRRNFPSLWECFDNLIDERRLIAPNEVLLELEVGGDDLYLWAKDREKEMFFDPDEEETDIVAEIQSNFPDFKPRKTTRYWADPYVIAIAANRDAFVISQETSKKEKNKQNIDYIPDVCKGMSVPHHYFVDIIKTEDWSF